MFYFHRWLGECAIWINYFDILCNKQDMDQYCAVSISTQNPVAKRSLSAPRCSNDMLILCQIPREYYIVCVLILQLHPVIFIVFMHSKICYQSCFVTILVDFGGTWDHGKVYPFHAKVRAYHARTTLQPCPVHVFFVLIVLIKPAVSITRRHTHILAQ